MERVTPPPGAGGSRQYGCVMILFFFYVTGFIVSDHLASKNVRRRCLVRLLGLNKKKDSNIGRLANAEWHGDVLRGMMPDKKGVAAISRRVGSTKVIGQLDVMLWGQQAHGTGWHRVGSRDLDDMMMARIVENGPFDVANKPGVAGHSIDTFESKLRLRKWDETISEIVVGGVSSSRINHNAKRIRAKDSAVGGGRTRVGTVGVGASHTQGDG
jgi:hypothetical protein